MYAKRIIFKCLLPNGMQYPIKKNAWPAVLKNLTRVHCIRFYFGRSKGFLYVGKIANFLITHLELFSHVLSLIALMARAQSSKLESFKYFKSTESTQLKSSSKVKTEKLISLANTIGLM